MHQMTGPSGVVLVGVGVASVLGLVVGVGTASLLELGVVVGVVAVGVGAVIAFLPVASGSR